MELKAGAADEPSRVGSGCRGLTTVDEAAKYLSISRGMLYKLMSDGRIPYHRIGDSRRLSWEDLDAVVAKSRVG